AVAALDGDAASGKSTAAELLGQLFGAPVIHTDDFYLPPELRTEARLAEPGGNFHRERFAAEVLPNLKTGRAFSYGAYDFHARATRRAEIPASELVFVEGAYCLHPALGDYADLRVFSPAAPDEQRRRILARNGEAGLAAFDARWIPMEKRYQAAFGVRARCDLTLPE
ncbi:MAG: uridine kinase, partial [Oscillospiraceae bacterium]|nr:uridine kinase [Oscillospiraceae bacterium]